MKKERYKYYKNFSKALEKLFIKGLALYWYCDDHYYVIVTRG